MDINTILAEAEKYCLHHKERLSKPRLEVLKVIASSKEPLGAYEILDALSHVLSNPKPPTAYRAIEFWHKNRFIHKIESLNAYVACHATHFHSGAQFMICQSCKSVTETHLCQLPDSLQKQAKSHQFQPSHWSLEIHGLCYKCAL